MAMKEHATAKYRIIADSGGSRYRFFCDVSGMVLCTTKPVRGDTQEEELKMAWELEGKQHFNRCAKCGRWVSDPMYNADMLQCVDCAPWQEKPNYCIPQLVGKHQGLVHQPSAVVGSSHPGLLLSSS